MPCRKYATVVDCQCLLDVCHNKIVELRKEPQLVVFHFSGQEEEATNARFGSRCHMRRRSWRQILQALYSVDIVKAFPLRQGATAPGQSHFLQSTTQETGRRSTYYSLRKAMFLVVQVGFRPRLVRRSSRFSSSTKTPALIEAVRSSTWEASDASSRGPGTPRAADMTANAEVSNKTSSWIDLTWFRTLRRRCYTKVIFNMAC